MGRGFAYATLVEHGTRLGVAVVVVFVPDRPARLLIYVVGHRNPYHSGSAHFAHKVSTIHWDSVAVASNATHLWKETS